MSAQRRRWTLVRPLPLLLLLATCDDPVRPVVDRAPPEISLHAPAESTAIDADSILIEAVARDDQRVIGAGYRLNQGDEESLAITPATEVRIRVVVRELPLGPNFVELRVTDEAEQSTLARVTFTVIDATAPRVTLTDLGAGAVTEADSLLVRGVAEDARGVARVVAVLNDGEEQELHVDSGSVHTPFQFMARGLRLGVNTVEIRAYDPSGNRGFASGSLSSRDAVPPVLTLSSPAENAMVEGDSLRVEGGATDDRGVVRLSYTLDTGESVEVTSGASARLSFSTVLRDLTPGAHHLSVTAADAAGNAASLQRSFTVAEPAPEPPPYDPDTLHPGDLEWREVVVSGLQKTVRLTAPAGDSRLFILEQDGRVRIVEDGELLAQPFLDVSGKTLSQGDRGLLGMAFDPHYAQNGYFYIAYSDRQGDTRIERYRVSGDPDRADPASMKPVLLIPQPTDLHHGGSLAFGPDGMLYITAGDGAGAADAYGNAQNPGTLLGAVLRIDVSSGDPYTIPADNPYVGVPGALGEVYAIGLRNPWRLAFDADGTLFVPDVGEDTWEEINVAPRSERAPNFGWPLMEGSHCFANRPCDPSGFQKPLVEYSHKEGCSAIGGAVYRGERIPALRGRYVYSDFCGGFLRSFRYQGGVATDAMELGTGFEGAVTAVDEDGAGELYLVTFEGRIYTLERRP
jgi:glucose/arabinose dehydrogenase